MNTKKTILITGANRGIGLALVKEAARLGVLQNVNLSNVEEVEGLENQVFESIALASPK